MEFPNENSLKIPSILNVVEKALKAAEIQKSQSIHQLCYRIMHGYET